MRKNEKNIRKIPTNKVINMTKPKIRCTYCNKEIKTTTSQYCQNYGSKNGKIQSLSEAIWTKKKNKK